MIILSHFIHSSFILTYLLYHFLYYITLVTPKTFLVTFLSVISQMRWLLEYVTENKRNGKTERQCHFSFDVLLIHTRNYNVSDSSSPNAMVIRIYHKK